MSARGTARGCGQRGERGGSGTCARGGNTGRWVLWGALLLALCGLLCGTLAGCTDAPGSSSYVSRLTTGTPTAGTTGVSDVDGDGWAEGFY